MKEFEVIVKDYINIKALIAEIKNLDFANLGKEDKKLIECFLVFPFLPVGKANETVALKKKDILFKKRGKKLIIRIETEFDIIHVLVKKYANLYEEILTKHMDSLADDDFFFMKDKLLKYRYQPFNTLLEKGYPYPLRSNSEEFSEFKKHPYVTLKRAAENSVDFIQKIPKM